MSGHSHAKTVKRVKDANDAKRGKAFSKLAKLISIAAKDNPDPQSNAKLKRALDEAKKYNLPKENIERAIKKATGQDNEAQLEEVIYEAIGPFGVNLIIEGITDNKNRTLSEIKQILQKHNAKLADEGSLKWQFEQKGIVLIEKQNQNKETMELKAIEAGATDTKWHKDGAQEILEIITNVEDLEKTKTALENQGLKLENSILGWTAKQEVKLAEKSTQAIENLFETLNENDDVQEIYSNLAN